MLSGEGQKRKRWEVGGQASGDEISINPGKEESSRRCGCRKKHPRIGTGGAGRGRCGGGAGTQGIS